MAFGYKPDPRSRYERVLLCAVFTTICADPEPKKYKPEVKPKLKDSNSSLTDEERKFLREVETKFGIKSEVPVENKDEDEKSSEKEHDSKSNPGAKLPFPAVIAIEIVNDTDTKSNKGKRTIDANLGYGYRTNNGYTYSYFGKPAQTQGKFMIYPYSQEDIPPAGPSSSHLGYQQSSGQTTKISPNVEITPSQAYELVPTKEEEITSYNYQKPAIQLKTKYENVQGVESPPPPYPASDSHSSSPPSTLYTTYNGEQFSGLSGQFPKVMSNYLVDSSQLLNNPAYQSAGLTQDHLRPHGAKLEQRVVPVLVLRVPSSYIKNPSAELYANLPQNYPLSQYLNHVNLQDLVNQYFKKIGYPFAPKVMAYPSSSLSSHTESAPAPVSNYEPQHYASPYVQPSYTNADYSGVQYSAVQPVMAKYPSGYTRQHYYVMRPQASLYQQPSQQPQYVYRYRYVSQSSPQAQSYYSQPQYQQPAEEQHTSAQQASLHDTNSQVEYRQPSSEEEATSAEYETPQSHSAQQYEQPQSVTSSYETVTSATPNYEHSNEVETPDYSPTKVPLSVHGSSPSVQIQYEQPDQKDTIAVYSRGATGHKPGVSQSYVYQNVANEHSGSESLVLSENYPSKDHTLATVLPLSYKRPQNTEMVQSVSYVTPVPTMKYHSQYKIMVPQTVLRRPTNEKVSYVNSHSLSSSYLGSQSQYNPEEEYTAGAHYSPPVSKQKPSSYPWNYHAHPKRMVKPDSKADTLSSRKNERNEKKKPPSSSS
ncbi:uncharacterized protein LOC126373470 [Pectinophora gossypiella]|uniref:uncharacterized protein LOC126373470 n=1 Tax=Pectinophora gossypiella TaxID=13191 RepID=UPI00214F307E|nr:uncharacterized protein LOC126373470 [Pectinophora gossypiella]